MIVCNCLDKFYFGVYMSVLLDKSSNMENVCDEEKKLFVKFYVLIYIFVNDMFLWLFCCCFICCFFFCCGCYNEGVIVYMFFNVLVIW